MDRPLIFCIGLNKTGTTSLSKALEILGWTPIHHAQYNNELIKHMGFDDVLFNAFLDGDLPYHWESLAELYPDAKFIVTCRNPNEWLKSRWKHFSDRYHITKKNEAHERWREEYINHYSDLLKVAGNPRFLFWDLCLLPQWNILCDFLNCPQPDEKFPHLNKQKS